MDSREIKGKLIAQTRVIKKMDDGFAVQSQNSKRFYFVDSEGKCNCPDCEINKTSKCKHAFAVQFYLQKVTIENGVTKIETKRLTYPQSWSVYNKSQETEKTRFLELLNDLIEVAEQGKQGRGQPKINEHDLIFASALKVYSQFSLRRFMSDLNEAKEKKLISRKPCFASVGHFMQKESLTPQLKELIQKSASVLKSIESDFAIDSTGFSTNHFTPYCQEKHGERKEHEFLKLHAVIGTKTNIITACEVTESEGEGTGDCPFLQPLAIQTRQAGFQVKNFTADMAYSSRENYDAIAELGGTAFIPFRSNATGKSRGSLLWSKMYHYFNFNHDEFMQHYHKRSNIESTFGALKAKFNDTLKSKTTTAQKNELLLKVLCFNIVQVIHETNEIGITAQFKAV